MFGKSRKKTELPAHVQEIVELYDTELRVTTETAIDKIAHFALDVCSELGVPQKVIPYVVEQAAEGLKQETKKG